MATGRKECFTIGSSADSDIVCAWMNFREAITYYLTNAIESDLWPEVPDFNMLHNEHRDDTVAIQQS